MTDSMNELPPPPKDRKPAFPVQLLLGVIILLLVIVGGAFLWQQQNELSKTLLLNSQQTKALQTQQNRIEQRYGQQLEALRLGQQALQQQVIKSTEDLAYQAQRLAQLGGGSRNDWLLAEAEYLLRLANQRLMLEHDAKGAELVLSAADLVLKEIDDPALLPARIALAEEILALQALPRSDTQGAYARISSLAGSIDTMPEKHAGINPVTDAGISQNNAPSQATSSLWTQLLNELGKAVEIRRLDEPVAPLLKPEEFYYLKHNLRLMYEQASLALVSHDQLLYSDSITKARQWLLRYFDQNDPRVSAQLAVLASLSELSLAPELPDISASLKLVKARIEALYREHSLDKETSADEKAVEAPTQ